MKVLVVEPKKAPYVQSIKNSIDAMQHTVGGYLEMITPFEDNAAILCDEEAKMRLSPLNRTLKTRQGQIYDVLRGTFIVVGVNGDSFQSLTDEQIAKHTAMYEKIEMFSPRFETAINNGVELRLFTNKRHSEPER